MSEHTPGPWTPWNNNGYSIWRITAAKCRAESASRTIAEVVGDSAETEANARLIAAAPEMFELLRKILSSMNDDTDPHWVYGYTSEIIEMLAKIEGGEA